MEELPPSLPPHMPASGQSSVTRAELTVVQSDAEYLDSKLRLAFGDSFVSVVDHELRRALNLGLFDSLATKPAEAMEALRVMFRGQGAVDFIFSRLKDSLRTEPSTGQSLELTRLLAEAERSSRR